MATEGPHYKHVAAETCARKDVGRSGRASTGRRSIFFEHEWLDAVTRGIVLAIAGLLWIILLVRVVGLRSFSKMTNFDFVMTVAMGSLLANASQSTEWPLFFQVLAAMIGLFFVQWLAARLRKASDKLEESMENTPILLMRDGKIIEEAMSATRVGRDDLFAKLRGANVLEISEVRAVVLETTGDVSVLHGEKLGEILLEGVKRAE
jgi:uncharacterized membrane protein YcaP (DUF421 family)